MNTPNYLDDPGYTASPTVVKSPANLAEAANLVRRAFSEEELKSWLAMPEDRAIGAAHWGLGMWIRNEWIHPGPCELAQELQGKLVFDCPDTVSSMILRGVWRSLNDLPLPAFPKTKLSTQALVWD